MLSWVKWLRAEQQIYLDPKRINPEIQAERRRELYGNVGRRRKIMDRMIQGYACTHPSWIQEVTAGARQREDDKPDLAA